MAILNIFKKEDKKKKSAAVSLKKKKAVSSLSSVKEEKKEDIKKNPIVKNVLSAPYFTEKAALLEKNNKYIFKVPKEANKIEIKKQVEKEYSVKVESVNIINVRRKRKRLGGHKGFKKGYKKAMVALEGSKKIDLS